MSHPERLFEYSLVLCFDGSIVYHVILRLDECYI